MSASLRCLLLGTADGERLRDWYRAAFDGVDTERGGLRFGDVELVIDERDDLLALGVEPGRLSLTFAVPDLGATQSRLRHLGTRWTDWSSATDPDGNVVNVR